MPDFIPGRELARAFYDDVIASIVGGRPHAAAFIGYGSDVLGYDSARSMDHGFGPRLQVFVDAADIDGLAGAIDAALPETFRGWPVRFGWDEVAVRHHVEVASCGDWLAGRLGVDPTRELSAADWLAMPHQRLAEVTQGPVFHDGPGELTAARERLAWYPEQVWLFVLASQWRRIAQEEPFVGRTAGAGDELGSRIVCARLIRDLMRLCFLLERRYPPYSKWLGTAFAELDAAADIGPVLERALDAGAYAEREASLAAAYRAIGERQNALGLTPHVDPAPRAFYGRGYLVSAATEFVEVCRSRIDDPWLASLAPVGSVDQFVDSVDVLTRPAVAGAGARAVLFDGDQSWH